MSQLIEAFTGCQFCNHREIEGCARLTSSGQDTVGWSVHIGLFRSRGRLLSAISWNTCLRKDYSPSTLGAVLKAQFPIFSDDGHSSGQNGCPSCSSQDLPEFVTSSRMIRTHGFHEGNEKKRHHEQPRLIILQIPLLVAVGLSISLGSLWSPICRIVHGLRALVAQCVGELSFGESRGTQPQHSIGRLMTTMREHDLSGLQ